MRQVEQLSAEMVALRREICSVGSRQPGCKALQRHYGIGPLLAVAIWEELGDCRRFTSSDDAVRHAGLDVTVWSSDGKRTRGHLAKQGPPVLRWEPGVVLTAGAATFVAYVLTHPRGDRTGAETLEEMVHSMSVESAWEVSHLIGLVAFVVIGAGMWMLLRAGWLADDKRARRAAGVVVVGTWRPRSSRSRTSSWAPRPARS